MEFNVCEICGANDGRAGCLMGCPEKGLVMACGNCHDTRTSGNVVIHLNLPRTEEEIKKTMDILKDL